jgi:hypothetical protein
MKFDMMNSLMNSACRFGVSEPRGSVSMYCYIIHERLLEHLGTHEEKQEMAKHLELLARIFLNHYHPHKTTLTGKTVDPKDASLLVLVTNVIFH